MTLTTYNFFESTFGYQIFSFIALDKVFEALRHYELNFIYLKQVWRLFTIEKFKQFSLQEVHRNALYRISFRVVLHLWWVAFIACRNEVLTLTNVLPKVVHQEHFRVENTLLSSFLVLIELSLECHEHRLKEESEVDHEL